MVADCVDWEKCDGLFRGLDWGDIGESFTCSECGAAQVLNYDETWCPDDNEEYQHWYMTVAPCA